MPRLSLLILPLLVLPFFLQAQNPSGRGLQMDYRLHIFPTEEEIRIDGDLSEAVWQDGEVATDFWMSFPIDGKKAPDSLQTVVRMTYDATTIYLGVTCYDDDEHIIQTLKRDSDNIWDGDAFGLVIDPVNQATNGFSFSLNPEGVQSESLVGGQIGRRGNGPARNVNSAWDNKWFAEVQTYPDRWTIEIAIPFKSLRFKAQTEVWGINFVRGDPKTNAYHTWTPVPVQFFGIDLGYTGALVWDQAPAKVRNNISLIPYALGAVSRDFEANEPNDFGGSVGADAKVAITSSLNLDITFNPDFSQVEVDRQVTNLTRFNVRFPERRLFFLENDDIFSNFGIPPMRPFFSRRIGLDEDAQPIPILYGLRLSGNLNDEWRIGLMNMQTRASANADAHNYSALAFHRRIWSRSVLKGYLHNTMGLNEEGIVKQDFNRNAGLEFDYLSSDGKWQALSGLGYSFQPEGNDKSFFYKIGGGYDGRKFGFYTNLSGVGENYNANIGFIPSMMHYDAERDTTLRVGFNHNYTRLSYTIFPADNSRIISHVFSSRGIVDWTQEGTTFNARVSADYALNWMNTSSFAVSYERNMARLLFPFAFTDAAALPATRYDFQAAEFSYQSDQRRLFGYEAGIQYGSFYNGTRTQYTLGLSYRVQPWGNFSLAFERNNLVFPDPYGSQEFFLISPRIEINFSRNIFWTTFLQYNTQADNFNINSRLQWRFQPMSDLFIVYTDNHAVEFWGPKNRALVVKLNYWLNI